MMYCFKHTTNRSIRQKLVRDLSLVADRSKYWKEDMSCRKTDLAGRRILLS